MKAKFQFLNSLHPYKNIENSISPLNEYLKQAFIVVLQSNPGIKVKIFPRISLRIKQVGVHLEIFVEIRSLQKISGLSIGRD